MDASRIRKFALWPITVISLINSLIDERWGHKQYIKFCAIFTTAIVLSLVYEHHVFAALLQMIVKLILAACTVCA